MKKSFTIIMILVMLLGFTSCTIQAPQAEPTPHVTTPPATTTKPRPTALDATPTPEPKEIVLLADHRLEGNLIQNYVSKIMGDVTFTFVKRNEKQYHLTPDELLPRLLANDNSFDVFMVSTSTQYTRSLLNKGYYVDLSVYPQIMKDFDHSYPIIKEACTHNDAIFGIPVRFDSSGHLYQRRPLIYRVDWTMADFTTLDDLYTFHETWEQSDQSRGAIAIYYDIILRQIIFRYIYNHYDYENYSIDLSTPEFEDVLLAAKKLYQSDICHKDYNYIYKEPDKYAVVGLYGREDIPNVDMHATIPQIMGHDDDDRIEMNVLITNPNIEDMDLVLRMYNIISEMQKTTMGAFSKLLRYSDIDYYQSASFNPKQYNAKFKELDQAQLDFAAQYYDRHAIFYAIPGSDQMKEIFHAYLKEEIDMDVAITNAQQILDLMAGETAVVD